MLNRARLILVGTVATLAVGACGTTQAPSASVNPPTTAQATPSSTEGEDITNPEAPPLVENGQLDPQTAALLSELSPPSAGGMRGGGAPSTPTVKRLLTVRDCSKLASWLKIKQPQLNSIESKGGQTVCGTNFSGSLPKRDGRMSNGEPVETTSYMIAAPQGVDVLNSTLDGLEDAGAITLSLYSGPNIWKLEPPMAHNDNPLGDAVDVEVRGVQVGVQHIGEKETRFAWIMRNSEAETFNAELMIPDTPVNAAVALINSRNIP